MHNISPATRSGRGPAGDCHDRARGPVAIPKKCSSRRDKCRQPDAEVENEPDHGGLVTCGYGNLRLRLLISDLSMALCIVFRLPKLLARARPSSTGEAW